MEIPLLEDFVLREPTLERAQLFFDLPDLQVVLLQRQQRFNLLLHPPSKSSCPRSSELLEVVSARCLQFLSDLVLLGYQFVLLRSLSQRNDPIEIRGAQVQVARSERRKAVADRAVDIDVYRPFRQNILERSDRFLIEIRSKVFDC